MLVLNMELTAASAHVGLLVVCAQVSLHACPCFDGLFSAGCFPCASPAVTEQQPDSHLSPLPISADDSPLGRCELNTLQWLMGELNLGFDASLPG